MNFIKRVLCGALAITAIISLSACSGCNQETAVSYEKFWAANEVTPYTETCVYDVKYLTDFNEDGYSFVKSKSIDCDITVSNESSYTTEISLVTPNAVPAEIKSLVRDNYDKPVYKLATDLNIGITYVVKGETMNFNDTVKSTAYFYGVTEGFKPIYSEKAFDTTSYLSSGKISRYVYSYTLKYQSDKAYYEITDLTPSVPDTGYVNYVLSKFSSASGSFETTDNAIDNETLLFAARNIDHNASNVLSVTNMSYGSVQKVLVSKLSEYTFSDTYFTVNGNQVTEGVKAMKKTVCLTDTDYTGSPIIASYSTDAIKLGYQTRSECFMLKSVTALPNGTGALSYVLKSVTIAK